MSLLVTIEQLEKQIRDWDEEVRGQLKVDNLTAPNKEFCKGKMYILKSLLLGYFKADAPRGWNDGQGDV